MQKRVGLYCQLIIAFIIGSLPLLDAYAGGADVAPQHKNPRPGVIASSSVGAASTRAIQSEVAGDDLFAGGNQPIEASLSGTNDGYWKVSIRNTTEDKFSLFLRLRQLKSSGDTLSSASIAVELKPLGAVVRQVSRTSAASGAELSLLRFRNRTEEREKRMK